MGRASFGQWNQAGDFLPQRGGSAAHEGEQTAILRGYHGPIPHILPYVHKYGGNLGSTLMRGVIDFPVYMDNGYGGDYPSGQQPVAAIPDPWDDPNAGAS